MCSVVRGSLHCVLAIAPRKDYAEFEEDLAEALITYIVEVSPPLTLSLLFCGAWDLTL